MGGGVQTGDIIPYLWSHGKQTMTTGCDCTGYLAPILGGGHGWLQGRYGKATDQLMSARLVLANGTAIFVSKDENADLFWAIRGAGHNFGIVTQATVRVYDRQPEQDQWAATSFVYGHDRLEDVASILNDWIDQEDRPEELTHYGIFAHNPDVDLRNVSTIVLHVRLYLNTAARHNPLGLLSRFLHSSQVYRPALRPFTGCYRKQRNGPCGRQRTHPGDS